MMPVTVQAVALLLLSLLGAHPIVAAALVFGGSVLLTGALHEDGLADVGDSLGGGTRERKLAIMKDSRLGTFGVMALILMALIKVTLFYELAKDFHWAHALVILVGAGVVSRALMTAVWVWLPAASATGLASEKPELRAGLIAGGLAVLALACLGFLNSVLVFSGLVAALIAFAAFGLFARWQYGGVTGDVCGATQILTELAFFGAALSLMTTW